MKLALAATVAVFVSGCQGASSRGDAPSKASSSPPAVSAPSAALATSASVSPSSGAAALPPPDAITPACCTMDRTEGIFGSEKGIYTRYSGDFLMRKDGERLLFPQDLISDTKELFQHARSAGKSVTQTRRITVVGEGARYVSVALVDHGETGVAPFSHSSCTTVDLRSGKTLSVDDVVKGKGEALVASGRAKLEATPGHEAFRFLPKSFAMIGSGEKTVRFCAPRRDDGLGDARMDVEVPVSP